MSAAGVFVSRKDEVCQVTTSQPQGTVQRSDEMHESDARDFYGDKPDLYAKGRDEDGAAASVLLDRSDQRHTQEESH